MTRFSRFPPRIFLVLALLLAAFLRFWQLSEMPPGLYHDEAYNGLDALSLLNGKTFPQFYEGWELYAQDAHAGNPSMPTRWPVFFEGNYGREPVHIYLMAFSIWLLGATPMAIRAVPAAAGVLGVFTTYLAARAVFRDREEELAEFVPIFSAFTLAVLFPAVHFSRFGLRAMVFVPVETLAVYFFWRGINDTGERGSRGAGEIFWFVSAGIMLGLGLYIYAAARLFPLLFVGFVIFWFWQDREALAQFWRSIMLMMGVAILTAVPILLFFAQYPYFFIFRIAYVANNGKGAVEGKAWLTWLLNIGRTIRGLFWLGETHLRHNLPGRPYLDPVQGISFLVGVVATLREKLQPRSVFLLLWLVVMLLPTIMSGDAPHFGRMTGAAPVIAIFIGLGVSVISNKLSVISNRFTVYGLLITALLASLFLIARDYFGRYADHPQIATDFYLPDWNLGQYAATQRPETVLYLTPTQEEMATIYFALADPDRLRSYSGAEGAIPAGIPGLPSLYFVRQDDIISLQNLQTYFPEGRIGAEQNGFLPFLVTSRIERVPYLLPSVPVFAEQIRLLYWSANQDRGQLRVTLVWQAGSPMNVDYTAFVHLLGADSLPLAQTDRPPGGYPTSDWQRGEIIADTFVIDLPSDLPLDGYTLQTGFYDLATLERLGEAFKLEALE